MGKYGIYVDFQAISSLIKKGTEADPDLIAESWYELYSKLDKFETVFPELNV
ncbi:hypothetical protein [Bacillus manliponensis]|uniref:hypothetical protein n=1 Tax=Bacillus manliponensis TaxID=574376 RepID=UPI000AAF6EB2|nr:hypothetical protein [Bacillus manliponensis]